MSEPPEFLAVRDPSETVLECKEVLIVGRVRDAFTRRH